MDLPAAATDNPRVGVNMKTYLFLGVVLIQSLSVAQTSIEPPRCAKLNELAIARAAANRLEQAEATISVALSQGEAVCAVVVSGYVATLMSVQGRFRDSEAFAARAVDLLRKNVNPDDPMLLRPLHVLAMARLQQGKFRKAEQTFAEMLKVRADCPEQRGQVHISIGVLRQVQGKWKEAESEYLLAYDEWKQLGRAADADAAAVLSYLGTLYIKEGWFKEASQALDRALAIVAVAENAYPLDRIKLLNVRAAAHARGGEWPEAQEKLRLALAIAEGAGVSESVLLSTVLSNYAIALRKNHHRREARAVESRASALPRDTEADAIIDIRELSEGANARRH